MVFEHFMFLIYNQGSILLLFTMVSEHVDYPRRVFVAIYNGLATFQISSFSTLFLCFFVPLVALTRLYKNGQNAADTRRFLVSGPTASSRPRI